MYDRFERPDGRFPERNVDSYPWAVNQSFISDIEQEVARREHEEVMQMKNPVGLSDALGHFGLLLGGLSAAAIFLRLIFLMRLATSPVAIFFAILMLATALIIGKLAGARLADEVSTIERMRWTLMVAASFLAGILWGFGAGGCSGAVLLWVGAPFGAIIGAVVGAIAFPIFISLHRILAKGGKIEASLLRPISFGVAAAIAGLILGL